MISLHYESLERWSLGGRPVEEFLASGIEEANLVWANVGTRSRNPGLVPPKY